MPDDLPEGDYTVTATDESSAAHLALRDDPNVSSPQNAEQVLRAVHLQTEAKRTRLTLRVPLGAAGVAVNGKSLPDLPAGVVQILGSARRTGRFADQCGSHVESGHRMGAARLRVGEVHGGAT